ncbi:MAG TPA: tripartite tricarboxylate transporter substrate-binding protein [Candidatus Binatia bacterium]|jgi:tripartite-type tricarboxylate transporter receptor subunit TctC
MQRIASAFFVFLIGTGTLEAQTPYFQRKTIKLIAGFPAGVAYDLYARLTAPYLVKHIPGKPEIIVQNMPGAGSMIAANYLYTVAKPDGLTIGSILPTLYFDQLIGRNEVQFDWAKFTWIGSSDRSNHLLYMRADSPYKTIHDVAKAAEPPKCGSTGTGATGYYLPKLIEEALGTKFNVVTGYPGGADIDLAAERGEIHCRALTIAAYYSREPYHTWRKNGFVRILLQTGKKPDERLPDAPTFANLMNEYKTPEAARRLATVVLAGGDFGRPMVASPGTGAEQVKILREAYRKALNDPELLAEAKKKGLDIDPTPGDELEALAKEVNVQPRQIVERMKKMLEK